MIAYIDSEGFVWIKRGNKNVKVVCPHMSSMDKGTICYCNESCAEIAEVIHVRKETPVKGTYEVVISCRNEPTKLPCHVPKK